VSEGDAQEDLYEIVQHGDGEHDQNVNRMTCGEGMTFFEPTWLTLPGFGTDAAVSW